MTQVQTHIAEIQLLLYELNHFYLKFMHTRTIEVQ